MLSDVQFANIFSHSLHFYFPFYGIFYSTKVYLDEVQLIYSFFFGNAFGSIVKLLPNPTSQRFIYVFSKNFIVLVHIWVFICFWLIFVYDMS